MKATVSGSTAVELTIGGLACAACAARVEKKLNGLDGVDATVSYGTETAKIAVHGDVSVAELIATVRTVGHSATTTAHHLSGSAPTAPTIPCALRLLRRRLLIAMVSTALVMALTLLPGRHAMSAQWLSLALVTPVVGYAAWPLHRAAWVNLRHGAVTMDTLLSVAITTMFTWPLWELCSSPAGAPGMAQGFSWVFARTGATGALCPAAAAAVTTLILSARYFEACSKRRAGSVLRMVRRLAATEATVFRGGAPERVPVQDLVIGDTFRVRPGEKIATDGQVLAGHSAVDASLLTGVSTPEEVSAGDVVAGATVNAGGPLMVRALRVGADTQLARTAQALETAQAGRIWAQRFSDSASAFFVPTVLVLAFATLGLQLGTGAAAGSALVAAITVLIAAGPCALGLAVPTALLAGTGRGAQLGILVNGSGILEAARAIDTIVLDTTGVITAGRPTVLQVHCADGQDEGQLLRFAGAVAGASRLPHGRAVATAARERIDNLPAPEDFEEIPGLGVQGIVDGQAIVIGRPQLLHAWAVEIPENLRQVQEAAEAAGHLTVTVAWGDRARAVLVMADTVRPSSREAVAQLRTLGLSPMLLTGDSPGVANAVAARTGIDEVVIAGALPQARADAIKGLQAQGRRVAVVGYGTDDCPAVGQADLGLVITTSVSGANPATGDVTLLRSDLRTAADAIGLSRRILMTMRTNVLLAFAYHLAMLPLAAAGLLNPLIGGSAMALLSVLVVGNSLLLRRFRIRYRRQ
ncbi:heavy metal translocating P-type ATPase [Streptomyces sp. SPB162]|uniref:heavy metal translocating P-type ATPase n=1 Tax=Streptomyces sp. SPB162 TaxID=2940560 RepID=UPI002405D46A|nr:heavy metal translocating P-type ATPase [Streptomyces sp. SPB162]MDF9817184.1 Cu+-exporting ATPase [Streptomyces sp. SPB162]